MNSEPMLISDKNLLIKNIMVKEKRLRKKKKKKKKPNEIIKDFNKK